VGVSGAGDWGGDPKGAGALLSKIWNSTRICLFKGIRDTGPSRGTHGGSWTSLTFVTNFCAFKGAGKEQHPSIHRISVQRGGKGLKDGMNADPEVLE